MSEPPTLLLGDCFEVLQTLEAESVDACVTDPPYGLSFMGKHWDKGVPDADVWREVYRVLKPGAHLLSFFGTRTYHRGAVAIEDAGFEIRDQIGWLYGSGFPKSLDVAKQDGCEDWDGWGTALKPAWEPVVVARKPLSGTVANNVLTHGVGGLNINACRVTGQLPWEQEQSLCVSCAALAANDPKQEALLIKGSIAASNADTKEQGENGTPQDATSKTDIGCSDGTKAESSVISSSTDGYGKTPTAQSPTTLRYITSTTSETTTGCPTCASCGKAITSPSTSANTSQDARPSPQEQGNSANAAPVGRWPGNLIHDGSDEVLAEFAKYGESGNGKFSKSGGRNLNGASRAFGSFDQSVKNAPDNYGDTGTAARFFYTAKASKDDRNDGLEEYDHTDAADMVDREPGSDGMNSPRAGAGRTSGAKNHHPTVKPTSLMRYLVRLVTPKGGLVLDPFAGSGTTLIAAYREDCRAIGIELDPEYHKMASHRIDRATAQLRLGL